MEVVQVGECATLSGASGAAVLSTPFFSARSCRMGHRKPKSSSRARLDVRGQVVEARRLESPSATKHRVKTFWFRATRYRSKLAPYPWYGLCCSA